MNFNSMFFMIAMVGWSVGVTLLVIGWYGRQTNDHPICRRCRFDLFGLEENPPRKCPECGTDVSLPGRVLHGQRAKRKPVVILALVVISVAAGLTAINLVPAARQIKWIRVRPTAWLLADVQASHPTRELAAVRELARRIKVGQLAEESLDGIVAIALTKQADRSLTWQVPYGEVLEEALFAGRLDDGQMGRLFIGMLDPNLLIVRDESSIESGVVNEQRLLTFYLDTGTIRLAQTLDLAVVINLISYSIDEGVMIPAEQGREVTGSAFFPYGGRTTTQLLARQRVPLRPGTYEFRTKWRFTLKDTSAKSESGQAPPIEMITLEREFISVLTITSPEDSDSP